MLCDLWSRGQFGVLWRLTQCRSNLAPSTKNFDRSLHPRLESFPKLTAAGPSAAGKAPQELAIFLSGASLTALSKNKPNGPSDIRPIAVALLGISCMDFVVLQPAPTPMAPTGDTHLTDDGSLAGKSASVLRALNIVSSQGPELGFNINFKKCELAGLSSHLEVGSGWGQESSRTRPADILVTNWDNGISAAFDVTVASPLNSSTITEVGMYSGAAARAAELRKHTQNDSKWAEISCKCIPLAVECYGAWGPEALKAFSQVATRLAIRGNTSKSMALTDLFGRLSHSLIRANARAILSRSYSHLMQQITLCTYLIHELDPTLGPSHWLISRGLLLEITFPVPATIPSILRYKSFSPFKLEEERFDEDHLIPAFGFGDIKTKDKSVFPLKPDGPCLGFEQVLKCYTSVAKEIQLSGPTNFAPLIKKAIEIVKKEQSVSCMCDLGDVTLPLPQYHILVIIADGQVTNEVPTRVAIVEASKYPLSIVVVGVGDGPWDQMDEFGELAERAFDNFQFVDYNKFAAAKDPDIDFAVRALMEIPDQFLAVRKLGLL
eukprot:Em0009g1302a